MVPSSPNPERAPSDPELARLVEATGGPRPARRLFHALVGVGLAGGLYLLDPGWGPAVASLALLTLGAFLLDLARHALPPLNRLFFRMLGALVSPREARGVASSTWYMAGCTLAVAVFPREIALASILVLALADPAASWAGQRWGGARRVGKGSPAGSLAFWGVATLVLFPVVGPGAAVVVGLVTAVAEVLPWPLDDNLVIPLVAGATAWNLVPLL